MSDLVPLAQAESHSRPEPKSSKPTQVLLVVLAIPTALVVLGRLAAALDLDNVVLRLASQWRKSLAAIWSDFFALLHIDFRLSEFESDALTFAILVIGSAAVTYIIKLRDKDRPQDDIGRTRTISLASVILLYGLFFWPIIFGTFDSILGNGTALRMSSKHQPVTTLVAGIPISWVISAFYFLLLIGLVFVFEVARRSERSIKRWFVIGLLLIMIVMSLSIDAWIMLLVNAQATDTAFEPLRIALLLAPIAAFLTSMWIDTSSAVRVIVMVGGLMIAGALTQAIGPIDSYLKGLVMRVEASRAP